MLFHMYLWCTSLIQSWKLCLVCIFPEFWRLPRNEFFSWESFLRYIDKSTIFDLIFLKLKFRLSGYGLQTQTLCYICENFEFWLDSDHKKRWWRIFICVNFLCSCLSRNIQFSVPKCDYKSLWLQYLYLSIG